MTTDRDVGRLLDLWLADGFDEVNDRVLDGVEERIGVERQRPGWRVSWRDVHMNPSVKLAAGLAAVIAVAVVGWQLLSGDGGVGGQPTPTPAGAQASPPLASAPPTVAPSSDATPASAWFLGSEPGCGPRTTEYPLGCRGELPAGTISSIAFTPKLTYTVPAGWVNAADWAAYYSLFRDSPATRAAAAADGFAEAIVVVPDLVLSTENCTLETAPDLDAGLSSGAIIDALAARDGLDTTTPADITLAGLTGRQIDVQLDPAWTTECAVEPGSPGVRLVGITIVHPGDTYRVIILDTPTGNLGVMLQTGDAVEFADFVAAATPVIESFQLDLP